MSSITEETGCIECQKPATFMCSSCGHDGPRYCSVDCQKNHWQKNHYKVCKAAVRNRQRIQQETNDIPLNDLSNQNKEEEDEDEESLAEELIFYTNQIYRIIKPVVACIILSIFWVKVSFSGQSDYSPSRPNYISISTSTTSSSSSSNSNSTSIGTSFITAAIIIGQIIAVTIIIVFLFKKGWIKVLIGFFMIVVLLLLGFMTYLLLLNLIQVFLIPLDYTTMVFALWNFAVVGLVSIFWKGPLWLQQSYLTMMSSLMAFSLTGLEQWTTWILLGLLAIWDLIAVLCPFGPLKLLIESSKSQQREVPALLYSVNAIWLMMANPGQHFYNSDNHPNEDQFQHSGQTFDQQRASHDGFMRLNDSSQPTIMLNNNTTATTTNEAKNENDKEDDDDDAERTGLKLGLGDFVFYSVLIARAAMYDWITTVCCTIAVLTGLTATIFLLAIYKKALPALPISIAFGILFYFVAKAVLVPYIGAICVFGMIGL
ncbi:hypothetical protein G6F37_007571 [Rhizopus arrhizus]|nr:hypothetical protein G6F38_011596 [Rhizopus arrhizus]KAG1156473.1 hypothetical protein G6F37_007571 [Rhizopus arrhizus]